ncbi:hypothetical protein Vadar_012757 [Vaccinium darrowii]|uniref:Uncharacterized protein n=1 Tax=Vaccinium darrowii TaxID=229202 RepID=A0ACB7YLU5_9ERIC|nr:hypothetical protein Vadar_012757 [Vaccinium darrowii]
MNGACSNMQFWYFCERFQMCSWRNLRLLLFEELMMLAFCWYLLGSEVDNEYSGGAYLVLAYSSRLFFSIFLQGLEGLKLFSPLDENYPPYDLIWEDRGILSGKSFYLPGSVDVHDQQLEQWNLEAPPLYLWSRPDWTAEHKAIAQRHGHLSKEQEEALAKGENGGTPISNYLMEENHYCY